MLLMFVTSQCSCYIYHCYLQTSLSVFILQFKIREIDFLSHSGDLLQLVFVRRRASVWNIMGGAKYEYEKKTKFSKIFFSKMNAWL